MNTSNSLTELIETRESVKDAKIKTIQSLNKQIGTAIARRRKELDMSQRKLANKLGKSCQFVSDLEKGNRQVSILLISSLTKALEL